MRKCKVDLVILDIKLPDIDGFELISKIININKSLPIIVNSASAGHVDDFRVLGAKEFIMKSGNLNELKSRVADFLNN